MIGLGLGLSFTGKWWDFTIYKKRYFVSILNEKRGPKHKKWVCIKYLKWTKFANFGFSTKGPFYDHLSRLSADIRLKMI